MEDVVLKAAEGMEVQIQAQNIEISQWTKQETEQTHHRSSWAIKLKVEITKLKKSHWNRRRKKAMKRNERWQLQENESRNSWKKYQNNTNYRTVQNNIRERTLRRSTAYLRALYLTTENVSLK